VSPGERAEPKELAPQLTSPFCLYGCPERRPPAENRVLFRDGFVLSNNSRTKFADWAAYHITPATMGKSKREAWRPDPDLPGSDTLEPEDFRGAHAAIGTDRGHQVPLASFSGTAGYQALAYMSNLTPQRSALNQQLWNRLEQAERDLTNEVGEEGVFVVTGPLFERDMPGLPQADEAHRVPSGYFKVIALGHGNAPSVAAFIVDQDVDPRGSHCDKRATVDEVERRASWDLFVGLADKVEESLEAGKGSLYERLGCR
jgi:endonuclease G